MRVQRRIKEEEYHGMKKRETKPKRYNAKYTAVVRNCNKFKKKEKRKREYKEMVFQNGSLAQKKNKK